jgi:uncharacterized lipoprotein
MTPNRHRRLSLLVAASTVVALAGCSSDALVPDVTVDERDDQPPATDTRTVDPPTMSNLPTTQP